MTPNTRSVSSGGRPPRYIRTVSKDGSISRDARSRPAASVGGGDVDEDVARRAGGGDQTGQQQVGDLLVIGEQRPDLGADRAFPHHSVAGKSAVRDAGERAAGRAVDPGAHEARPRGPEDARVERQELLEGHRGQLHEPVGALAAGRRAPANVPVGELETAALVRVLLREHAVQSDDSPAGPLERAVEQSGAEPAAAKLGAHDVETDEGVALAVQGAGDGCNDLAVSLRCEEGVGIRVAGIARHRRAPGSSPRRRPRRPRLGPHDAPPSSPPTCRAALFAELGDRV